MATKKQCIKCVHRETCPILSIGTRETALSKILRQKCISYKDKK